MTDQASAKKPTSASENTTSQAPDFTNMSAKIMQIAARSQKLLGAFLERNKASMGKMPASDPAHIGQAFMDFTKRILANPEHFVEAQINFWQDYIKLLRGAMTTGPVSKTLPTVIAPDPSDKRFKDPAWQEAWVFDFIKQSYLLTSRWAQTVVDHVDGIDPKVAHKIEFYTHQMIDAMSPTNFWATNPEVLRATLETKGENLVNGLTHMLDDIERGHGQLLIKMSDSSAFQFGVNIASTPGKVVYQNELMQLIQFSPLTETVYKTPILITPPWINKYYILDLKPDSSFIRFLVEQGHTVYIISWVNPDGRHSKMGFDDYMMLGPVSAAREIKKITGSDKLNAVGYCIGGTLLACTLGWLAGQETKPADLPEITSATYLVTLIDFQDPGDISVFIDEDQVQMIEGMMQKEGFLPATYMGTAFSMLRANDLVWSFVINNYLLGRDPFPFDLLAWNSDSTNLPAAMQSYYLRNMYMANNLIKPNTLSMKGVPINLQNVKIPTFCLSTVEDHITPWKSTYVSTQTYSGPVTFCLSGSGHIAGVVNPPAKKKYNYWTNDTAKCPADPEEWLKAAEKHDGSWWPHWAKWLEQYGDEKVPARDPAANANVIEDAPGSYVKVRVM